MIPLGYNITRESKLTSKQPLHTETSGFNSDWVALFLICTKLYYNSSNLDPVLYIPSRITSKIIAKMIPLGYNITREKAV
jgi:hypothetical protein